MKIHGICLIKNEADIIEHTLRENARWCDRIYVYDNGSDDDTWERVNRLAAELPAIIPFKSEAKPFRDSLRGEVFNAFSSDATDGDWWCRLDGDELYADDPREFLAGVPPREHVVWSHHIQFFFTEKDTGAELPRHYRADYSEPRFFRHRAGLVWTDGAWPRHLGIVHKKRIRVKHYQWRSPDQIARRLNVRRKAMSDGYLGFPNSQNVDWRQKVRPSSELNFDHGDGNYLIEEHKMPGHLESGWRRIAKHLMHGLHIWP